MMSCALTWHAFAPPLKGPRLFLSSQKATDRRLFLQFFSEIFRQLSGVLPVPVLLL